MSVRLLISNGRMASSLARYSTSTHQRSANSLLVPDLSIKTFDLGPQTWHAGDPALLNTHFPTGISTHNTDIIGQITYS